MYEDLERVDIDDWPEEELKLIDEVLAAGEDVLLQANGRDLAIMRPLRRRRRSAQQPPDSGDTIA